MSRIARLLGIEARPLGPGEKPNDALVRFGLCLAAAAVAVRLFFWWYTGRVWEDALIAVLHSENLVRGLGLTHVRVGEGPVQGFSSPLGVMIPLMADVFHVGWGLPWLKLVSAFAGGVAVLYTMAIALHPKVRLPAPLAVLSMAYVAFEHHQILWGMAGMETQLATCILLMSVYYAICFESGEGRRGPAPGTVRLAVALALCMYARPDFAFWTLIVGVYVFAHDRRQFLWVAGIALALYAPWIVFTTLYYGSPIPNTIVAKGLGYELWSTRPGLTLADVTRNVWARIGGHYLPGSIFQPLGPSFAGHGTHFSQVLRDDGLVCRLMLLLAIAGGAAAIHGRQWAFLPIIAFAVVYSAYYVFGVAIVFGWYVVPFSACVVLLSARGLAAVATLANGRLRSRALWGVTAAYLAVMVGVLPTTIHAERRIQRDIEGTVREPMAQYLAEVMDEDDTVACEALGYVGYYSGRTVYDWPGLASRRVVEYSRAHPEERSLLGMAKHLRPDYIILRPFEYEEARARGEAWLDADYRVVKRFEAPPERIARILLISRSIDCCFLVFEAERSVRGAR
ncbi:MAG: hypothetical protein GWP08_15955 [Nitrospiraceae bacterium]|nr:hypothetical protein [Nitrospiraceae bacterium]